MSQRPNVFELLANSGDPAADEALLAALPSADLSTAQAVVESLLSRRTRRGLHGLVCSLHLLNDNLREDLLGEMDQLFGVLREAARVRDPQIRLNVQELIQRSRAYRAAYLLEGAFRDRSAQVRQMAGETLYILASEHLTAERAAGWAAGPSVPEPPRAVHGPDSTEYQEWMEELDARAEDRRQLIGAVEAGLTSFDLHRDPRVVEVAMWFADELGAKAWSVLSAPASRTGDVAMQILAERMSPRLLVFALHGLTYSHFRTASAAALSGCTDPAVLTEWGRQAWRLAQPKFRKAMHAVKSLACLERHALLDLPSEALVHWPRWLGALGVPLEQKVNVLHELHARGDAACRQASAWAAVEWVDAHSTALLRDLARGDDAATSRLARYELARRRPMDFPLADVLPRDPQDLRKEASKPESRPRLTFAGYWHDFEHYSEEERARLGEQLVRVTPDLPAQLRRRLIEPDPRGRIRALRMAGLLGMAEHFAEQIYHLSHDEHPEVRSAAMIALGDVPGAVSKRILQTALCDADRRVQANAVEAVERSGDPQALRNLAPLLSSADNRVRANAVKALLRVGVREAAETLLQMLTCSDRAQQVSALWLIEHMGLFSLAARVVSLAATAPDAQVRTRAEKLTQRLYPPERSAGVEVATSRPHAEVNS